MVLILLSTPNHAGSFWPSTPKSFDMTPLSPRTPSTPSPSFFAILSPIFTADDTAPPPSAGLLQVSPGMIPPETPPPWLLGPQSPAAPARPSASRSNSMYDTSTPTLPRLAASEGLMPFRQRTRPAFPSTTYSFTAGHAQAFRPPPPLALKHTKTAPIPRAPSSPLRKAISNAAPAIPELKVRPPSREKIITTESESIPISFTSVEVSSPVECESMDIPIGIEAPTCTPVSVHASSMRQPTRTVPRSAQQTSHSRSHSAPVDASSKLRSQRTYKPLELTPVQTTRLPISVANLKQFDKECAAASTNRLESR